MACIVRPNPKDDRHFFMVKADPGWSVVYLIRGDNERPEEFTSPIPVIAWSIERREGEFDKRAGAPHWQKLLSHEVSPVLADGSTADDSQNWYACAPDGRVFSFDANADNLAEMLAILQEEHDRFCKKKEAANRAQQGGMAMKEPST